VAESFFSNLKNELIHHATSDPATKRGLRSSITSSCSTTESGFTNPSATAPPSRLRDNAWCLTKLSVKPGIPQAYAL
jgi:hypothetical protein